MKTCYKAVNELAAWKELEAHHKRARGLHLPELSANAPCRGERMPTEAVGIFLDYSKNRITDETLKLLLRLAEEIGLRERILALIIHGEPT